MYIYIYILYIYIYNIKIIIIYLDHWGILRLHQQTQHYLEIMLNLPILRYKKHASLFYDFSNNNDALHYIQMFKYIFWLKMYHEIILKIYSNFSHAYISHD